MLQFNKAQKIPTNRLCNRLQKDSSRKSFSTEPARSRGIRYVLSFAFRVEVTKESKAVRRPGISCSKHVILDIPSRLVSSRSRLSERSKLKVTNEWQQYGQTGTLNGLHAFF
jgi:hypothetical protein